MASAKTNYDLVGSDYSMSSGKGTTSSFSGIGSGIKNVISGISNNRQTVNVADYKPSTPVGQAISGSSGSSLLSNATAALKEHISSGSSSGGYYYGSSGSASGVVSATPQVLDYLDAPYASAYGMDVSTAYNEALANTAYQRKVKDLKAAGLNPVLGISGSGANNFYGTPLQVISDGSSYSGGSSYGSSGSASGLDKLASIGNQVIRNLPTLVGGIVGLRTGGNVGKAYAASQISQGISNIFRYS